MGVLRYEGQDTLDYTSTEQKGPDGRDPTGPGVSSSAFTLSGEGSMYQGIYGT